MGTGDNQQNGVDTGPGKTSNRSYHCQPSEDGISLQDVKIDAEEVKDSEAYCEDRYASESSGNGQGTRPSGDGSVEMGLLDGVGKKGLNVTGRLKLWFREHKCCIIIGLAVAAIIIVLIGASVGLYYWFKPSETNGLQSGTEPPESIDLPCGMDLVFNRKALYSNHKLRQLAIPVVEECGIRLNNSLLTVDLPAKCNGTLTCLDQLQFCYEAKGGEVKNITCSG